MKSIARFLLLASLAAPAVLGQINRLEPGDLAKRLLPPVFNPEFVT